MRRTLRYVLSLLAIVAVVGGGAAVVLWSVSREAPAKGPTYVTAPVEKRTLRQTLVVRGTLGYQELATLRLAGDGRVTAVKVRSGDKLKDGRTVLAVDGRPVVAIKGMFPFWRDLRADDKGKDVRQLEQMLKRAGYDPGVLDDTFTWYTEVALRKWQKAHGFEEDGVLRAADTLVAKLPARVGDVKVTVGDFAAPGAEVATITGSKRQVKIELSATDRQQVKAKQAATVEISATGDSLDGQVSKVSTAPAKDSSSGSGGESGQNDGEGGGSGQKYPAVIALKKQPKAADGTDVRVTIVLNEEPDVLAVPAGAVVLDDQGRPTVRVLTGAGKGVESRSVETGMSDGSYVAVISGLSEGETVVIGVGS